MNPIKILSSITRLIILSLSLILVLIVLLAFAYEPESGGEIVVDPENPIEKNVNLFADDPGYKLFREWDCTSCHRVDRKLIGPALAGVTERREKDWLYAFIKNSSRVIGQNDPTAVALFEEYNKLPMPNHDLSNEQIDLILSYIEKASQ